MRVCKHCGDAISGKAKCDKCDDAVMTDQCRVCHNEVAHDIVKIQNIHVCGNRASGWPSGDGDTDAYGQSWRSR